MNAGCDKCGMNDRAPGSKLCKACQDPREVIEGLLKEAVAMHEEHVWPVDDKLERGYHLAGRAPRSCTICREIKRARDFLGEEEA